MMAALSNFFWKQNENRKPRDQNGYEAPGQLEIDNPAAAGGTRYV